MRWSFCRNIRGAEPLRAAWPVHLFLFAAVLTGEADDGHAACFQNGSSVLCTASDFDGFLSSDGGLTVEIEQDALVRNLDTGQRRGNCPLSFPAISIGAGSSVSNNGAILTFGVCGAGIQIGENSTAVNSGSITTNDILGTGIDAAVGSTVTNDGSIITREFLAQGIFAGDMAVVTNTANGLIQTAGTVSTGISGGSNVVVVNDGTISTTGEGSRGIDLLSNGTVANNGQIDVAGFQAAGIRLQGGTLSVTNTGAITGTYVGPVDDDDREDGIQVTGSQIVVTNSGMISMSSTGATAIRVSSDGPGEITVSNTGTLSAPLGGLIATSNDSLLTVINSGTIRSTGLQSAAIQIMSGSEGVARITNSGEIDAGPNGVAIAGGDGREEVVSSGAITGDLLLGAGNDLLTLQSGTTFGAEGNLIDGGDGLDELVLTGGGTLTPTLSGFEELTRFGAGTWVIDTDVSFSVRSRLFEGDLVVTPNSRLSSPDIIVFDEAVLTLQGIAEGNVSNSGTLIASKGARIDGTYTQSDNGAFVVPDTQSSDSGEPVLSVSGSATLGGSVQLSLNAGPPVLNGSTIFLLRANSIEGNFSSVDVGGGAFLSATSAVDADVVHVLFNRVPYATAAGNDNAIALAEALDAGLGTAPDSSHAFFQQLDTLSLSAAGDALDALTTSLPLSLATNEILAIRNDVHLMRDQARRQRSVWGSAGRSFGSFDGATDGRMTRRATQLAAGLNVPIRTATSLTLMLSQTDHRARSKNTPAMTDGKATSFGASLSTQGTVWTGHVSALVTDLEGTTQRQGGLAGNLPLAGDTSGTAWALNGTAGRDLTLLGHRLALAAGVTHIDASRKGMTELGDTAEALRFEDFDATSTRADASLTGTFDIWSSRPALRLSLSHDLSGTRRSATAAMALFSNASFPVRLKAEERTWVEYDLSIPFKARSGWTLTLRTGGTLNDKTVGTSASVLARYAW